MFGLFPEFQSVSRNWAYASFVNRLFVLLTISILGPTRHLNEFFESNVCVASEPFVKVET